MLSTLIIIIIIITNAIIITSIDRVESREKKKMKDNYYNCDFLDSNRFNYVHWTDRL